MKLAIVTLSLLVVVASLSQAANGPADGPRVCITNAGTNRKFPIHVNLGGTVEEVKQTIHKMGATTPDKLELKFKGQSLEDKQTLEHYNIGEHSDLVMEVDEHEVFVNFDDMSVRQNRQDSGPVTLFFYHPKTIPFGLDVHLTDTIAEVKEKIHKQEEFPLKYQKLINSNGLLEDSRTLESYHIVGGEYIKLEAPLSWCYNKA